MIRQIIPQAVCLDCRMCCRFNQIDSVWAPHLLAAEIEILKNKEDLPEFLISSKKTIIPVPAPSQECYLCPFLEEKSNRCKIYALRPFECQLYPFLINLREKKITLSLDLRCPYIKENLSSPAVKEYIDYLCAFFSAHKIFLDNPQLIQEYAEVKEICLLDSVDGS